MRTDSEKLDLLVERMHSIDARLFVLEKTLGDLPSRVVALEAESKAVRSSVRFAVIVIPVVLLLVRWLGLSPLIQTIGEFK